MTNLHIKEKHTQYALICFITDYFAEVLRELRKVSFADAIDKYFKLGNNLNQRDVIAVKKTVSGLAKLLYPDGNYNKEQIEQILRFALEMRRRVKEQLKKIGGMEFFDVNFSYIDNETFREEFVSVPEQGGGTLIPEGLGKPGHLYTVGKGVTGMLGTGELVTSTPSDLSECYNISINVADIARSVDWSSITNKPSTFTPSSHTHPSARSYCRYCSPWFIITRSNR